MTPYDNEADLLHLTRTPHTKTPGSGRKRARAEVAEGSTRYTEVDNIRSLNGRDWAIKAYAAKCGELRCEQSMDERKDNKYIWNSNVTYAPKELAKVLQKYKGKEEVHAFYR